MQKIRGYPEGPRWSFQTVSAAHLRGITDVHNLYPTSYAKLGHHRPHRPLRCPLLFPTLSLGPSNMHIYNSCT